MQNATTKVDIEATTYLWLFVKLVGLFFVAISLVAMVLKMAVLIFVNKMLS